MARSVLARFLGHTGMADFAELERRADADPGWLTEQVLRFCDFRFYRPYARILDTSRGIERADWCVGGTTNIVLNCLDRHRGTAIWDKEFLVWEGEDGQVRRFTYGEFDRQVGRLAAALLALGIRQADRVALYLPNIPEAFVALFAVIKIGAIAVPLFSGFGVEPLVSRLRDAGAQAVITAGGTWRRGSFVPMKAVLDAALEEVPGVSSVVVVGRQNSPQAPMTPGRDRDWDTLLAAQQAIPDTAELPAEAPAILLYTSGTTGKPKGCVWTQVSFLASMALRDVHICGDFRQDDRLFFMSDMGWMVGPMSALLPSYFGASVLLAEGVPDYPRPDRFWNLADGHAVSYLGVSPTIVRGLMRYGPESVDRLALSRLRITCSGGEPWNDAAWLWFFEHVCRRRIPIVNLVGGTEVCGCNFVGTVCHPMQPGSFSARGLGCGVDIVDEQGSPVADGVVGELVLRNPGIGMTKSIWGDDERYLDTYWRTLPGVWVHGDLAVRDRHGLYYVLGRSDDTIKVSGKRTGPAELESVLTNTGEVIEAAVIGVPDDKSGSAIVCVCVPMKGAAGDEALGARLSDALRARMGAAYRPKHVYIVDDLPRTRNMKIMRRVVRAAYLSLPVGDLSSCVNPESVAALGRYFGTAAQAQKGEEQ
ncbi:AMP-binding protein [Pigmentiphaga sp. NML030171]|uniref:AMP-binding protein n=2 Tax=Pigmentiphaga TaxID=152267 RepID=UPI0020CE2063|nr:AMP-binding protein [Pigmentiphaga sp. NML030171]